MAAGKPGDAPLLLPAIRRIARRFGRAPRAVTADRGYGEAAVEQELKELGVNTVAILRKAKPGAARRAEEHRRRFRRLVKWRTGCEGRISHLKHGFGGERTRFEHHRRRGDLVRLGILARCCPLHQGELDRTWRCSSRNSSAPGKIGSQ